LVTYVEWQILKIEHLIIGELVDWWIGEFGICELLIGELVNWLI